MICLRCSTQNRSGARYCAHCGLEFDQRSEYRSEGPSRRTNSEEASRRAVVSAVLGLSSLLLMCGPITGLFAILSASRELQLISRDNAPAAGRKFAVIGLITGLIGSVGWMIFWMWKLDGGTNVSNDVIIT